MASSGAFFVQSRPYGYALASMMISLTYVRNRTIMHKYDFALGGTPWSTMFLKSCTGSTICWRRRTPSTTRPPLRLGIADSTMRILYTILDNGERCLLSDVYKQSGISKQTVNSALRKLESGNMVYLENHKGKAKTVCLTDAGKALVQQTAARLYDAERRALETWTGEEIDQHIALLEKYLHALTEQVQAL